MTRRFWLLLIASIVLTITVEGFKRPSRDRMRQSQHPRFKSEEDGRLPRNLIPYHYDLDITTDFYRPSPPFTFTGTVDISFDVAVATNLLTVNVRDLTVNSVTTRLSPDSPQQPMPPTVLEWRVIEAADFLNVTVLNSFLPGAKYIISITYAGTVRSTADGMFGEGLYYDSYISSVDGSTNYIIATQLQPIYARQVFPCFDEPDLKATFTVTVAYKPPFTALSNMPIVRTDSRPGGWLANVHQESPIMSAYQVCIVIGLLSSIEANWQGVTKFPIKVYGRPDIINQLAWVAEAVVPIYAWLEAETEIEFPLPKMDHAALPSKGGAAENWGLITYGEQYFAVNPETSTAADILQTGTITSHELAHQYYGDLVTAAWWSDTWLNEGLTSYYDYLPTAAIGWSGTESFHLQKIVSTYQLGGQGELLKALFAVKAKNDFCALHSSYTDEPRTTTIGMTSEPSRRDVQNFLDTDQKNTSDPVIKQIDTVFQVESAFSRSTYAKGSAMVTQLQAILGASTFNAGLKSYLNKFAYGSSTTDDLWQTLSDTIMDPWLKQMGLPLLTVSRRPDGTATVTQTRLFYPPNQQANVPSPWNYKWTVPLTVVTALSSPSEWNGTPTDWFDIASNELLLTGLPHNMNQWIIVNPRQRYYYRVLYDDLNRFALAEQLLIEHEVLDPESRGMLIDDNFVLARASYLAETDAMEMTKYLGSEMLYNPWYAAFKYTSLSSQMLRGVPWYSNFATYMLSLITPVYNAIGWDSTSNEDPDEQILRTMIIDAACGYGLTDCVRTAENKFRSYAATPDVNSVDPNVLSTVLCTGVASGGGDEWATVYTQYQARRLSQSPGERGSYLRAMSCTMDSQLLEVFWSYIIQGTNIATRDQYRATLYLSQNPAGTNLIWSYFDNSWSIVPPGVNKFSILQSITRTFATNADLNRWNSFAAKNPPQTGYERNTYSQITLTVEQNIRWLNDNQNSIRDWLVDHLPLNHPSRVSRHLPPMSPLNNWDTGVDRTEYWTSKTTMARSRDDKPSDNFSVIFDDIVD